jgi:hypothetical protein
VAGGVTGVGVSLVIWLIARAASALKRRRQLQASDEVPIAYFVDLWIPMGTSVGTSDNKERLVETQTNDLIKIRLVYHSPPAKLLEGECSRSCCKRKYTPDQRKDSIIAPPRKWTQKVRCLWAYPATINKPWVYKAAI